MSSRSTRPRPAFRTYREVGGSDRSDLAGQVQAQVARVAARLAAVERVVVVMSGKGGVGKSHVAAGLAIAAAGSLPGGCGLLDADLAGPTAAHLLGVKGPLRVAGDAVTPAVGHAGVRVVSTDLLLEEDAPLRFRARDAAGAAWRGALAGGVLREFLGDVEWGPLGLLVIDLPPGADGAADVGALVPDLAGAVVVTLPSEESRRSVARSMRAAAQAGVALLGVIENMSGYLCAGCTAVQPLFAGDAGFALSQEFGVPLLGRVPFAAQPRAEAGRAPAPPRLPDSLVTRLLETLA